MGSSASMKCFPEKEVPEKSEGAGTTTAGFEGDEETLQAKLREMERKYEESQKALEAQKKVCEVQEEKLNKFQSLNAQTEEELLSLKQRSSVAISEQMLKYQKEGSGKLTKRKVTFLHTDAGENILIVTDESKSTIKQFEVTGVSNDPKSISTSKIKADEGERILIVDCKGKKIPLLVESQEIRDKWHATIANFLE